MKIQFPSYLSPSHPCHQYSSGGYDMMMMPPGLHHSDLQGVKLQLIGPEELPHCYVSLFK